MNFFSHFSPVRSFPTYTGPHKVGSCDVELPVSNLASPAPSPDESLATVSFRVFYPCADDAANRPVKWIPSPQSSYGSAYCRFLGASPAVADILALFPQFLYMTKIPVQRNGKLLDPPTSCQRWPVIVFSHGLGGSRNAYSHLCGSLASYGIIVIAPDHRDSSAPISFVRATDTTAAKTVPYKKQSHTPSPEVYQARDLQLRIRLWELGCIHDAIVKMDLGQCPKNLDPNSPSKGRRTEVIDMFHGKMDLHQPGSIIWAGHSFGAATMIQFMKSVYYGPPSQEEKGEVGDTLFLPEQSSPLIKQITNKSVAILLDTWCLPLRSKTTRWLWEKPMPCYDTASSTPPPAGGQALVTVLSEAFFVWEGNMNDTKRALSPNGPAPDNRIQWTPFFFYPTASAHLNQSDFGILFPWITSRVLKTKEPERLLRLNTRVLLQVLRLNGFEIAGPAAIDLEHEPSSNSSEAITDEKTPALSDPKILAFGEVRDWNKVEIEGYTDPGSDHESEMHVEEDYQAPRVELDEAEVLSSQTPGKERDEAEVLGLHKARSHSRKGSVAQGS